MTDSTADLPAELAAGWGITVVPCLVHFGQETFREGVDLSRAQFYRRLMTAPQSPTTASPGPGVFAAVYRQLAAETEQIVSIHLFSTLSGVFNAARLGAEGIEEAEVAVMDSGTVTMGLGWLAVLAARAARAGQSLKEVVQLVEAAKSRARVFALLDTLKYLCQSGRVNRLVATLSALLDVKPLLSVEDGDILALGRVRSRRKALGWLASLVEELGPLAEMAVLYSHTRPAAEALADRLAELFPRERMVIAEVGSVIGTHVGPNGLGVACLVAE